MAGVIRIYQLNSPIRASSLDRYQDLRVNSYPFMEWIPFILTYKALCCLLQHIFSEQERNRAFFLFTLFIDIYKTLPMF